MFYFSKNSLKKLYDPKLHNDLRKLMLEAIKDSPIDFSVLETTRTIEQQIKNVQKGVSKTLKSRHIPSTNKSGFCEAIDIAPYPVNWKNIGRFKKLSEHIFKKANELGIKIEWGGNWTSFKDYPHYELD